MGHFIGGINRRLLDQRVLALGGTVTPIRRTGEVQYSHPALPERPRADGRRKDAPRHLVAFVHRVERRTAGRAVAQIGGVR
jgi:hypothetical protein